MARAFTHEHDPEIAHLYQAGQTTYEIAGRFGVTPPVIARALKRHGIPLRPGGRRTAWEDTENNRRALAAAHQGGEPVRSIARRLGIRTNRVTQVLDEAGAELRPGGRRRFSDEEAAEFARAYRSGETLTQIGRRYGVAAQAIRSYLVKSGVQLRPVGAPAFWTDERKAEATRRHQAGEQLKDIAAAMGCGTDTLARTLAGLGVREMPSARARAGAAHHSWRGGRITRKDGYIQVKPSDADRHLADVTRTGYMLEHRLVTARKLGRALLPGERPHHKNLIRSDNSPGNLELWLTAQPPGARVADLIEWSLGLLDRYMPEALVPGWRELSMPEAIT